METFAKVFYSYEEGTPVGVHAICAVRLVRLVRQYSASGEREAPRRGAFFIAQVSEGRSPDDPGNADGSLSPLDPARGRS